MIGKNGQTIDLDANKREYCDKTVERGYADKAYRTIAIAYRDYTDDEFNAMKAEANNFNDTDDMDILDTDLTVISICGIRDTLRPGIKQAV